MRLLVGVDGSDAAGAALGWAARLARRADAELEIVTAYGPARTGVSRTLYDELRAFFGLPVVPDIMKLVSTRPDFLRVMLEGYKAMFGGGHLPRQVKEMIGTVVSKTNSCSY